MAFVIPKQQKKSAFEQVSHNPGPGAYEKQKSSFDNTVQFCAPFNTSVVKVSAFDVPQTNYGPGSYNSAYYKDLNKSNVVNKNYVFASRVQRFKTTLDSKDDKDLHNSRLQTTFYSLSPNKKPVEVMKETYEEKLEKNKSIMNEIRQKNNQNKVESIKGKRQFVRVILTSTANSENLQSRYIERNISGKAVGPGDYQPLNCKKKAKSVPKWDRDRVKRFDSDKTLVPGPGAYYQNQQPLKPTKKQKPTSAFASTQIRSHMDTVIYKTNIPIKAAILQDKRIKDSQPGPGSYNAAYWNQSKKSFNYGAQTNFGTSDREGFLQNGQYNPGPGAYNSKTVDKINIKNDTIKEIRNQIFNKGKQIKTKNKNHLRSQTGIDPNLTYGDFERKNRNNRNRQICSLKERCYSKLGNMNQAQRFAHKEAAIQPGPGAYSDGNENLRRGHSAVFNSSTIRQVFQNKQEPLPFYNVIRNDIGFKAEKMKRYIQNLRKINIVKTPFQTSTKRFIEKKQDINIEIQKDFIKKSPRDICKKEKESSAFKSGTKREVFNAKPMPGPGDYQSKVNSNGNYQQLEKKSFNKNYNYIIARPKHSIKIERSKTTTE